ncbi:hypothetical protein OOK60_17955 [Trichothermofontia sichuanensis B231]|uniref:hypothetical protein n=1 Tax=Trichothermofontia sichuanensis TaxID=3045816 RepID=UPI0022467223|nr:hypothetical protein [Trichothermofontia sichuanensis]UZQ54335.1 hypothetical protein OOK60_17955 [Trichothermofontia sichuanensis B231]
MSSTPTSLVTLQLDPPHNTLAYVQQLAGLQGVTIDTDYGLVLINPTRSLYVVRVMGPVDAAQLMAQHPEVKGVHGDVNIQTLDP